jgi:hypothetical protein
MKVVFILASTRHGPMIFLRRDYLPSVDYEMRHAMVAQLLKSQPAH